MVMNGMIASLLLADSFCAAVLGKLLWVYNYGTYLFSFLILYAQSDILRSCFGTGFIWTQSLAEHQDQINCSPKVQKSERKKQ